MPELVFYVVAENEERPHIAYQMHPAAVQKHAAEQSEDFVEVKLLKEKQRNQPEILKKHRQSVVAKRNFKEKNYDIDQNDQVRDGGKRS